jgi:hypothetical protein
MIPDDPNIFNQHSFSSIPRNFDDQEARLRTWLGQDAVPTAGGRHLLYCCPLCKRPWYKAGKSEYPRMSQEQLALLGEALHTDVSLVCALPQALCSICSATSLGGMFTVEEYRRGTQRTRQGYHFSWEGVLSQRTHLIGMICRREQLTLSALLRTEPDTLATPMQDVRAVLAWIDALPLPDAIFRYSDEDSQLLGQRIAPGTGTERIPPVWRGYSWIDDCPPLQGEVLVSLATALHPRAYDSFTGVLTSWKLLARTMRTIL